MTPKQKREYTALSTSDRAKYLLAIGVDATTAIRNLDIVSQACVGDVLLPIFADSDAEAIRLGTEWLHRKAGHTKEDAPL